MNTFPNFSSFCQFATFRCSKHKFYVKRIPCSDVSQLSNATQSFTSTAHPSAPLTNDSATSLHQRIVTPEGTTSVSHIIPQRSHGVPDPLRSHIDRLLVLSFVVSGQEPIRRFQYNGSKKNVGSRHLSKAADSLIHEEQIRKTLQDAVALLRVLTEHKKHSAVQKEQVISDQESGPVSISKWANKTTSEYDTEEEQEDTAVSDSKRGEKQHLTAVSDYDEGKLPDNEAITDSDAGQRLEGTPAADDVTGNLLDSNTIYGYDPEEKLDIREK
ncbi:acrosin-binding protein [Mixophyes fleayi]|uniref:acrosin-binding protein n=1 Tax=Mixophyes fleayi TaxID=3061075 RepID=UPI003F4D9C42